MSNEFVSALSANVNAGALILNDYLLEVSDIEGGHRLSVKRGSEVQTMDVLDGAGGSAAQVQADWNQSDATSADYVKNRPCYHDAMGDTVFWNGETASDVVKLPLGEDAVAVYSRVAGNAPTAQQLEGAMVTMSEGSVLSGEELMSMSTILPDGFAILVSLYVIVVPRDNYILEGEGITFAFPRKGVYMTNLEETYPASMTVPGFEFGALKQLDARLVPGYDLIYDNSVAWDGAIGDREVVQVGGNAAQLWVHVSDDVCNPLSLITNGFAYDLYIASGDDVITETVSPEEAAEEILQVSPDVYMLSEYAALFALRDGASFTVSNLEITLPRRGLYYLCVLDNSTGTAGVYMRRLASDGIRVVSGAVLKEEVLPAAVQRVGGDVILNSSTEGSTKRFVLRVDDSGTITATEITE